MDVKHHVYLLTSKTTAQVNIALTKFETALQVSVLICVLVLWDGAVKRLLT